MNAPTLWPQACFSTFSAAVVTASQRTALCVADCQLNSDFNLLPFLFQLCLIFHGAKGIQGPSKAAMEVFSHVLSARAFPPCRGLRSPNAVKTSRVLLVVLSKAGNLRGDRKPVCTCFVRKKRQTQAREMRKVKFNPIQAEINA